MNKEYFDLFFSCIGNKEKQKRFNSLIEEKNLTLEDLDLIFDTIKPYRKMVMQNKYDVMYTLGCVAIATIAVVLLIIFV